MPQAAPILPSFTTGEVSPRVYSRVDYDGYYTGLKRCFNAVVQTHGPVTNRGGTYYVASGKDATKKVRLVPFIFGVTQAYVLEFGHQYIRVYREKAQINVAKNITGITKANPGAVTSVGHGFLTGDVVEIAGVVGMTQVNGNSYTITKTSADTFTIGVNTSGYTTYTSGGTATGPVIIETTYTESELDALDFSQVFDTLRIVHKDHAPAKLTRSSHTAWTLSTISFTGGPAAWTTNDYPMSVTTFEQRCVYGGNPSNPQTLWFSKSGLLDNFTKGTNAEDGLEYMLASDGVNYIRWISGGDTLLVGTAGGEFKMSGASSESAITPTSVKATELSRYGSVDHQPVRIANSCVFVQNPGRKIRKIEYEFETGGYVAPDLSLLSEHITRGKLKNCAYQSHPDSIIWFLRTDGVLVGCNYEPLQKVLGFHWHQLGGVSDASDNPAVIESMTVIPSSDDSGRDEIWLSVKRYINSTTVRTIEYMTAGMEEGGEVEDAFYVDCGLSYDGSPTTSISGLEHLEGEEVAVLADGAVHPSQTVSGGAITLELAASKVHVGLGYNSEVQTLNLNEGSLNGTAQGKIKRISEVRVRLYETVGCEIGPDENNLYQIPFRTVANLMDTAIPLFSGDKEIDYDGDYETEASVFIRQSLPLPFTLQAIMPLVKTNG